MTSNFIRIAILMLGTGLVCVGLYAETHVHGSQPAEGDDWLELNATMDKMHMAMAAIQRSGDAEVDFVRLMLPHHQGAIDMAKVELIYGHDPVLRRLAEGIIVEQQQEIELMQRSLNERSASHR